MKTLVRPEISISSLDDEMARKKKNQGEAAAEAAHQMSLRLPVSVYRRIEKASAKMGLDATSLVRMIVRENLAAYERRAEEIV